MLENMAFTSLGGAASDAREGCRVVMEGIGRSRNSGVVTAKIVMAFAMPLSSTSPSSSADHDGALSPASARPSTAVDADARICPGAARLAIRAVRLASLLG